MRKLVLVLCMLLCGYVSADDFSDSSIITISKPGQRLFDYVAGPDVIYLGKNINVDAATSDDDWIILKFTYVAEQVTQIERRTGTWDSRTSLF